MTHVPYKGIQAIAPDLVSGEVHLVFNAFGLLNPFVQAGKVKLLAVTSAERLPAYPDVPSLAESALPGFDATGWYILFAPSGTPRTTLERLNAELRSALADRDTAQKIEKTGMRPVSKRWRRLRASWQPRPTNGPAPCARPAPARNNYSALAPDAVTARAHFCASALTKRDASSSD